MFSHFLSNLQANSEPPKPKDETVNLYEMLTIKPPCPAKQTACRCLPTKKHPNVDRRSTTPINIWKKITRWFKVTFWSPSWRSLNLLKGHKSPSQKGHFEPPGSFETWRNRSKNHSDCEVPCRYPPASVHRSLPNTFRGPQVRKRLQSRQHAVATIVSPTCATSPVVQKCKWIMDREQFMLQSSSIFTGMFIWVISGLPKLTAKNPEKR